MANEVSDKLLIWGFNKYYIEMTNLGIAIPSLLKKVPMAPTPFLWAGSAATFSRIARVATSFDGGFLTEGTSN